MESKSIFSEIASGDPTAADKLLPLVYGELRSLAAVWLNREDKAITLEATGLVHEAYLRLAGTEPVSWECRGHFFASAAIAMRRILIERARRKKSKVHGGEHQRITFDPNLLESAHIPAECEQMLELDAILNKFASQEPQKAKLVELRFFAGLTRDQAAEVLGISAKTADRYWTYARAWIRREIERENHA